jgi:hypothetical protein
VIFFRQATKRSQEKLPDSGSFSFCVSSTELRLISARVLPSFTQKVNDFNPLILALLTRCKTLTNSGQLAQRSLTQSQKAACAIEWEKQMSIEAARRRAATLKQNKSTESAILRQREETGKATDVATLPHREETEQNQSVSATLWQCCHKVKKPAKPAKKQEKF